MNEVEAQFGRLPFIREVTTVYDINGQWVWTFNTPGQARAFVAAMNNLDTELDHCGPGPFTPTGGNNDGKVRNGDGEEIADTFGHEGRAEEIARALNRRDWKPISTVPRDRTVVLSGTDNFGDWVALWSAAGSPGLGPIEEFYDGATHWTDIPEERR